MGIDFTWNTRGKQETASWAYSGFKHFRERLAKETGHTLSDFWPNGIGDEIDPLLNHSDCDGELTVEECKTVAPRLKQMIMDWPDDDYDKRMGLTLANNMMDAALSEVPLIFT